MDNAFGAYLKTLRQSHSPMISQEALAKAIGKSKMTVSLIESGKNAPPQGEFLGSIVKALELDEEQKENLMFLAAKPRKVVPQDIEDYFFDNPAICSAIRAAMNSSTEVDWKHIASLIGDKNG